MFSCVNIAKILSIFFYRTPLVAASGYSEDPWKLVLKFLENEVLFSYEKANICESSHMLRNT